MEIENTVRGQAAVVQKADNSIHGRRITIYRIGWFVLHTYLLARPLGAFQS